MARSLSHSSLSTLRKCPEQWRRKYIERERTPASGSMIAGSAAGAAADHVDLHYIEHGEFPESQEALDVFDSEWAERADREEVDDWTDMGAGALKDATADALTSYIDLILTELPKPIAIEREARLTYEGIGFVAYLDREQEDGSIADRKLKGKPMSQADADNSEQPTRYMAVRRAEAEAGLELEPTGFEFHTMVRQKTKRYAKVIQTERTPEQLDEFLHGLYRAAEEIDFRTQTGNWSYAAEGAWWCSQKWCGFWDSCPGGGLLRTKPAEVSLEVA